MKKTAYYFLSLAAIVVGGLTSCQDEDLGYTADQIKYESEFVKEFGKPDPNHNWGFVDMPLLESTSGTRGAGPNSNEWGYEGLDVPYPMSELQKRTVTEWFATTYKPNGIVASWTDYFAQHVSSTANGSHMDKLIDASTNSSDHIYNFNGGKASNNSPTAPWLPKENPTDVNDWPRYADQIQYMTGQSTRAFSYHETVSGITWADHFVIIPGEMIDPDNVLGQNNITLKDWDGNNVLDKDDNTITINESIWGMWFVGFDYEAKGQSASQIVNRDYYFNDWIIRISPGTYSTKAQRVMCEDLGGSFDWDFNDVVFDAYITGKSNTREAHITIQCAGGTLPITVGTTDPNYEIHNLFGVSSNTVVIAPPAPAQYTVKLPNGEGNTTNVCTIPVYVDGVEAANIQVGNTPQRFACPTGTAWADELQCITKKYPNFPGWVVDHTLENTKNVWELHPNNHPFHPSGN